MTEVLKVDVVEVLWQLALYAMIDSWKQQYNKIKSKQNSK
jgi:hypothetical protein